MANNKPDYMALLDYEEWQNPINHVDNGPDIVIHMMYKSELIKPWIVIVEMYDRKNFGRGKRQYSKEFTEEERKVISHYYRYLYNWYLRTGFPDRIKMNPKTFSLMTRAANFFASLT